MCLKPDLASPAFYYFLMSLHLSKDFKLAKIQAIDSVFFSWKFFGFLYIL